MGLIIDFGFRKDPDVVVDGGCQRLNHALKKKAVKGGNIWNMFHDLREPTTTDSVRQRKGKNTGTALNYVSFPNVTLNVTFIRIRHGVRFPTQRHTLPDIDLTLHCTVT